MLTKVKRRKLFPLSLTFLLLILILTSPSFTKIAEANFVFGPSNPIIYFKSPVNTTYTTNNISLTVEFYTYKTGYYGAPEEESLRLFQYSLDGREFQPIEITNSSIGINPGADVFFEGLIHLEELSEGRHELTVNVVFNYSDLNYPHKVGDTSEHYNMHTESNSNDYFIIDTIPDNNSLFGLSGIPLLFPIVVSIVAVVVVIVVSVFMYYKRGNAKSCSL